MKIGILYICIGKYDIFWPDFYSSCEKYFIPEAEKHYFVFTDNSQLAFFSENRNIHLIPQTDLGWPHNTLMRYEMFLRQIAELRKMDFLFFFNSNILFIKLITAAEFLPSGSEQLVGGLHSGFFNKPVTKFTYERRLASQAFIAKGQGKFYFQGAINGGRTDYFLKVIEILNHQIKVDLEQKIIAGWHDESHWNSYLNKHLEIVKVLSPAYLYPAGAVLPFNPKIVLRNKKEYGGHINLRRHLEGRLLLSNFKAFLKRIIKLVTPRKVIKIQGGLGNQLFQYAYGRNLEFLGQKVTFDISFFQSARSKKDTARDFKLNHFNINPGISFSRYYRPLREIRFKIRRVFNQKLDRFYQGEKYFNYSREIIRQEFYLKEPLTAAALIWQTKINQAVHSVSLHIRRGDYISNKKTNAYHGVCSLDYYQQALQKIVERFGSNLEVFVFSDDIVWAKENLSFNFLINYVSSPQIQDYEELILMAQCQDHIIANSSFSWWGAWLDSRPNKIVVAPQYWLVDQPQKSSEVIPASWLTI